MQTMHAADHEADRDHIEAAVHHEGVQLEHEIRALRSELRELKTALLRQGR
jgi:voltage-gated sodium channel